MRIPLFCVLLLCAAVVPLHAETYKWVDEKGVTNYSNTPPPARAAKAQVVAERISVVPSDPMLGPAIAAMRAGAARRAEYAEMEWLQRQSLALTAQANTAYPECPYRADCSIGYDLGYPFYYPSVVVFRGFNRFPPAPVHRTSFPAGRTGMMRSSRGLIR